MKALHAVSVVALNKSEITKRCIESVLRTCPEDTHVHLTDNGSNESEAHALRAVAGLDSRIRFKRLEENIGFGPAHVLNLGTADSVYFVVLNNDVIVSGDWLERMRREMLADSSVVVTGIGPAMRLTKRAEGRVCGVGEEPDYVEGSCLMVRTHEPGEFGGLFDPTLRMAYCEDADLSLRVRSRGRRIVVVPPDGLIEHVRATTSGDPSLVQAHSLSEAWLFNHHVMRTRWREFLERGGWLRKLFVLKRSGAMGDVVMLEPVIRALKHRHSDCLVGIQTSDVFRGLYTHHPDVEWARSTADRIEPPPGVETIRFDLDLSYESRPLSHPVQVYLDVCGVGDSPVSRIPRLVSSARSRRWAEGWIDGNYSWLAMHSGPTAWKGRNAPLPVLNSVVQSFQSKGWNVVQVGGGSDFRLDECDYDLRGQTNVDELIAVLERCDLFVGLDSGPMHVAQAALIPCLGIFGAVNPRLRLIPGIPFFRHVSVHGLGCLGCHHWKMPPATTGECLLSEDACMTRLSPEAIVTEALRALEEHRMFLETSKIRDRIVKYCSGAGVDIGCSADKILPDAVGVDDDPGPQVDHVLDASRPLPFLSKTYDYVYSSHCLEDIADTEGTLNEWLRILVPGGFLILYLPHKDLYTGTNLDHKHDFVPRDITSILEAKGCEIVENFVDSGPDRYSFCVVARKPGRREK